MTENREDIENGKNREKEDGKKGQREGQRGGS
jgi:hypothetical protein